jgi:hypothetical protein
VCTALCFALSEVMIEAGLDPAAAVCCRSLFRGKLVASVMAEGSSCCSGGDWMVLVLESGAGPVAVECSSGERTQCGRR